MNIIRKVHPGFILALLILVYSFTDFPYYQTPITLYVTVFLCSIYYFLWFFYVGKALYKFTLINRNKYYFFIFNIIFSYVIFLLAIISMIEQHPDFEMNSIFIPFFIYNYFAIFYSIYTISKGLVMNERKGEIDKVTVIGFMVLLFLFPIGIIVIQKKINRLFDQYTELLQKN